MKQLFYCLLLIKTSLLPSLDQPCSQFNIEAKKQKKILSQFIAECEASGDLKPSLGIILLTEWTDAEGQLNWQVCAQTSWRQYAPIAPYYGRCTDCLAPVGWTRIANRIVLRYQMTRERDTLSAIQASCLKQLLVGSIRFIDPPVPNQPVPVLDSKGQPILGQDGKLVMSKGSSIIIAGNGGGHNTHIVFKKDGSINKGLSL